MCGRMVSDTANMLRNKRNGNLAAVPLFRSGHMSAICARPSKGKGEIHKRVENRRLSTLLCAPPRRRVPLASQAAKKNLKKIKKF